MLFAVKFDVEHKENSGSDRAMSKAERKRKARMMVAMSYTDKKLQKARTTFNTLFIVTAMVVANVASYLDLVNAKRVDFEVLTSNLTIRRVRWIGKFYGTPINIWKTR